MYYSIYYRESTITITILPLLLLLFYCIIGSLPCTILLYCTIVVFFFLYCTIVVFFFQCFVRGAAEKSSTWLRVIPSISHGPTLVRSTDRSYNFIDYLRWNCLIYGSSLQLLQLANSLNKWREEELRITMNWDLFISGFHHSIVSRYY